MDIFRKVKAFLLLKKNTKLLMLEAFFLLGWARLLKSMSFSKVAPSFGKYMEETSFNVDESRIQVLKDISHAVNLMSLNTFWESMCLVKAIAAMKMLERRKIESTLYLGTAKDETGKLVAHAWLRSGPFYITGYEVMHKFIVVSKFAKEIRSLKVEP